jgi:predicted porin
MQKKIIALAIAAAFAAPAVAMAEVTMYGTLDGGLRHQTNDNDNTFVASGSAGNKGGGGTTDSMQMGQYNTARFGLKASDDLGDGMKANVVLETSLAPGGIGAANAINGAAPVDINNKSKNATYYNNPFGLLFDRQATIGLSGGWGSADLGWNYSTSFTMIKTYDPFDYKYLAIAGAKSSVVKRMGVSNVDPAVTTVAGGTLTASPFTPVAQDRTGSLIYKGKFGDIGVQLEYDVTDATKNTQPGGSNGKAVGVTYASGPINVGVAYTIYGADPAMVAAGIDNVTTHITAGAGYNYGDGKVSVGYAKNTIQQGAKLLNFVTPTGTAVPTTPGGTAPGDTVETNMWLGASFNMSSKVGLTAAYYSNVTNSGSSAAPSATSPGSADTTKKIIMVGATYNLSKATQLYVEMDRAVSNTGVTGTGTQTVEFTTVGTSLGLSTAF